ncbi:HAD family hydrolase [Streptomyces sp. NPDC048436]|uniref:HAD family hydrolase n=1 Tax=Streptomyces sp. NPDC048436 TaxID=3365550 RepID=UPI0037154A5F
MTIKGALFDFSGTLFRIESTRAWLRAVLDEARLPLAEAEHERLAAELERAGALPGGASPAELPGHLAELWSLRDRSAEQHRAAYTGLAREVTLPDPCLYDALYDRHMKPEAWRPYADAPDPRLFAAACEALGVDPADALMVGDDRHADAGAAALGCALHFVDHLPADLRPDQLRPVIGLVDRG